jgi:hypothetical protein
MVARGDTGGLAAPSPGRIQVGIAGDAVAPLSDLRTGFRSAYVFEIQDIRQQRPLDVHVLALNPERYTLSEPFQSTLTPAEDNTVVAEENGTIIRELTIEGTPGLRRKRGPSFTGDQGNLSGTEHFKHLRDMFRCYSAYKQDPRRAANIRMVFHSLRDDDHFVVVPRTFEAPRDARTTRMHYTYRISLAVIAQAENTLSPLDLDEGFDFFTDELAAIAGAFNDARAGFAEITADLNAVKRKVANIQAVALQAAGLINSVGNMFRAGGALIEYPFQLVASVLETVDNASDNLADALLDSTAGTLGGIERSIRRMSSAIDRIAMVPNRFGPNPLERTRRGFQGERQLTGQDIESRTAGATVGSRTRLSVGTGREAGLDLGDYRGVRRVRIDRTDTVVGLATRYGTTEPLIILINDLRFPYIAEGGGPGILKPGDIILIPVTDALGNEGVSPQDEYLNADEALYGVDLALDPVALAENRLEIRVNETGDRLDADLSRGLNNVIQGTEITVRTERGSTAFVPEVGILRSVGVKGTIQHVIMASLNLREAILADPRIEGIQDTTVVLENDVLNQEISPRLKGEAEGVTLVLPFGKASGG